VLTSLRVPAVMPPRDASQGRRPNPLGSFTLGVAALDLRKCGLAAEIKLDGATGLLSVSLSQPGLEFDTGSEGAACSPVARGTISPLHPLTIDQLSREAACVPDKATHFAFSYPVSLSSEQRLPDALSESFTAAGGFLYFSLSDAGSSAGSGGGSSSSHSCRRDRSRDGDSGGERGGASTILLGATAFTRSAGQGIHFWGPVQLDDAACRAELDKQGRLVPPTLQMLKDAGVKFFTWLSPREGLGSHDGSRWDDGGFAYFFDECDQEFDCVFALSECRSHVPLARLRS